MLHVIIEGLLVPVAEANMEGHQLFVGQHFHVSYDTRQHAENCLIFFNDPSCCGQIEQLICALKIPSKT